MNRNSFGSDIDQYSESFKLEIAKDVDDEFGSLFDEWTDDEESELFFKINKNADVDSITSMRKRTNNALISEFGW